ncbi:MAG: hypothetical protein Unbinned1606contig1000_26 [Prokaryotic dsDNA virus sp.]|nr:MAG: hypothetical protein Unbinned1606contig1000_26 [Prokaryotic dsDNA virus sp.]|tara:strand:- start:4835 stop:5524 length:690 start_codon:yes stop_codon:yes gene_type:complete
MLLNFSATTEDFVSLPETVTPAPAKPVSQTRRRRTTKPNRRTTKVVEKTETPKPKPAPAPAPTPEPPKVVAIPPNASVEAAEALADDPTSGVTARMFREWYEAHAVKTPRQQKAAVPVSGWEVTDRGRVKHTLKGEKRATSKAGETVDRILKRLDPAEYVFLVQQLTAELCSDAPISTEIRVGKNGDYEHSTCGAVTVPSGEAAQKRMWDRLEAAQLVAEQMQKMGLVS